METAVGLVASGFCRMPPAAPRAGQPFEYLDALAAGYTPDAIRHLVRRGDWIRVRRRVYAEREPVDREPLLVALRAAQLTIPDAVASHHTAAQVHGLALFGPTGPMTLTRAAAPGRKPVDYPGVRVQRAGLPQEDVTEVHGVAVTTVARTACDRARTSSRRAGVVTADAALRAGIPREELVEVLDRCRRWPGRRRAGEVVALADPRAESALESVSRIFFVERSLPAPTLQAEIRDDDGYVVARVDFDWDELGVVGEADGDVKYTQPWNAEGGDPLRPLLLEKRRQERIEAAGRVVVRWDFDGILRRGDETEARLRAAFARAGRLRGPAA